MSKFAELRNKKGLTQQHLADLVDVSATTIRNWEHGRKAKETFKTLANLCDVLECDLKDLI